MEHIWQTIGSPQELSYAKFYTEQVNRMKDGDRFVEVGVYYGRSFSYFIVEMINAGKTFDCVAVDACPWDGEPCTGFHRHMEPLKDHYRVMFERVDSFVAAKNFEDNSIDFCFIDANHTYEFVSKDIAAYRPKIKPCGVLAGHDWSDDGVKKAVREAFPLDGPGHFNVDIYQDIWYVQL